MREERARPGVGWVNPLVGATRARQYAARRIIRRRAGCLQRAHTERDMPVFKPDEREQSLIERALRSHRRAQARARYAPKRLVEKWSAEGGIEPQKQEGDLAQSTEEDQPPPRPD